YADESSQFRIFHDSYKMGCSPDTVDGHAVGCEELYPVRHGNDARMGHLTGGQESLAARLLSLQGNPKDFTEINIQALIFTGDETGNRIAQRLIEIKNGNHDCKINVSVDSLSNPDLKKTQAMYLAMRDAKINFTGDFVQVIDDMVPKSLKDLTKAFEKKFSIEKLPTLKEILEKVNKRYHDKLWIVKRRPGAVSPIPDCPNIVIMGGMNIANEYFRAGPDWKFRWRDQDVLLCGKITEDADTAFKHNLLNFEKFETELRRCIDQWTSSDEWAAKVKQIQDGLRKVCAAFHRNCDEAPRAEPLAAIAAAEKAQFDFGIGLTPLENARILHQRPRFHETYINDAYISMIKDTLPGQSIKIANAYFIPPPELRNALEDAKRRGVKIQIVTNSKTTNDEDAMTYASRKFYKELMDAPGPEGKNPDDFLEIHEWQGMRNPMPKGELRNRTIHAKFMVAGCKAGITGSFNHDPRSFYLNSETALAYEGKRQGQEACDHFMNHDLQRSKIVTHAQADQWTVDSDKWFMKVFHKEMTWDNLVAILATYPPLMNLM
ncbi:MAG: phospholipase D-like domain-containing protein, partial [Bdellovibrionota bacterium]